MVLAASTGSTAPQSRSKEPSSIVFNVALLSLVAFVAWGRFGPYGF